MQDRRFRMFDHDQLCDKCHTVAEQNEDGAVYYPDPCPRCQAKMKAWMDGIFDLLEESGAGMVDLTDDQG
jgi:hypothetical protein